MPRKLSDADMLIVKADDFPREAVPLAKVTGDPDMAIAIVKTDQGVYPSDLDSVADFLGISKKVEDAALTKYLKWKRSSGAEGARLLDAYETAHKRSMRLFGIIVDGVGNGTDERE